MNDEIMSEVVFNHGEYDSPSLAVGSSVLTYQLGLKQFDVVYDRREGKEARYKIIDIEIDLIRHPVTTKVFLEPVKLIVGQHDVGEL
jgi:hypothetical protein